MAQELTALPDSFPAGTTVKYRRTLTDYPASAWTLRLILAGAGIVVIDAVADGDDFLVTLAAADTSNGFPAGVYRWVERVSNIGGEVYEIASGSVTITPDLSEAGEGSEQDWVERTIAALKVKIEARIKSGLDSYQVAGRVVQHPDQALLLKQLATLESRLFRAANPDAPLVRTVQSSFTRPDPAGPWPWINP